MVGSAAWRCFHSHSKTGLARPFGGVCVVFPLGRLKTSSMALRVQFVPMGVIGGAAVEFVNGVIVGVEPVDGVTPDCEGVQFRQIRRLRGSWQPHGEDR